MARAIRVSDMEARPFLTFTAAAFLLLLTAFLPGAAHAAIPLQPLPAGAPDNCAQTTSNSDNAAGTQTVYAVNQNFQNAFAHVGYLKTNAAMQVLGMFGAIDVKAQYCWDSIKSLFEEIGNLQNQSLNPFDMIVSAIISQIGSQILNLINSACTAALTSINNFKSFLLSQLNHMCLPVPNLDLGLGNFAALQFSNAQPCGSSGAGTQVPLLTFGYSATPMPNTSYRNFP